MKPIEIAYWLQKRLVWLRRIRHRCGYGIHSPFAFNLVTRVVYEKGRFIGYDELDALSPSPHLRTKDLRLLFRLANDLQPRHGLAFSADHAALESLRLGCRRLHLDSADTSPAKTDGHAMEAGISAAVPDFFYTDHADGCRQIAARLATAAPAAFVVVAGTHRDRRMLDAWNALAAKPSVRVTFDLYDFGFASLDARYARQHYTVNYL